MTLVVEVRRLAEADIARIEAEEPPGQDFVRTMWRLQERGSSVLLVAWVDGAPVGSAQLDRSGTPVELKNLNVDRRMRGLGVGTALIRAAEAEARPSGTLAMGVGLDNTRARALYERLGYEPTGRRTTTTYEYVDEHGVRKTATETDELLVKVLG